MSTFRYIQAGVELVLLVVICTLIWHELRAIFRDK